MEEMNCLCASSSDCSRLILPQIDFKLRFVNRIFSDLPKKLPIMLYYTLLRLTLFFRSCLIKSLVCLSICLYDCQCNFSPHVLDSLWLCIALCLSLLVFCNVPLSSLRSYLIIAVHPHLAERVFSFSGLPYAHVYIQISDQGLLQKNHADMTL
jgi:hypothetical protein